MDRKNKASDDLLPAGMVATCRFSDGTIDIGGELFREDEQGQLLPVPVTDPAWQWHEEWKQQCEQACKRALMPRQPKKLGTRRGSAAARKKSRSTRRKGK